MRLAHNSLNIVSNEIGEVEPSNYTKTDFVIWQDDVLCGQRNKLSRYRLIFWPKTGVRDVAKIKDKTIVLIFTFFSQYANRTEYEYSKSVQIFGPKSKWEVQEDSFILCDLLEYDTQ